MPTHAAYRGEIAIEMARNFHPGFADHGRCHAGHLLGIEAAIQVRDMLPACKVLLFSGQLAAQGLVKWRANGIKNSNYSPSTFTPTN